METLLAGSGIGGPEGLGGLLNLLAMEEGLSEGECDCESCKKRRKGKTQTKRPEQLMAELALRKIQASERTGMEVTAEMLKAFASKIERLEKQLKKKNKQFRKQRDVHDAELSQQRDDYRDVISNFQKNATAAEDQIDQMQKSIDGKVYALQQGAAAAKKTEEEEDLLRVTFNTVSDFVKEVNKDSLKPELKDVVENIAEAVKVTEGLMKTLSSK